MIKKNHSRNAGKNVENVLLSMQNIFHLTPYPATHAPAIGKNPHLSGGVCGILWLSNTVFCDCVWRDILRAFQWCHSWWWKMDDMAPMDFFFTFHFSLFFSLLKYTSFLLFLFLYNVILILLIFSYFGFFFIFCRFFSSFIPIIWFYLVLILLISHLFWFLSFVFFLISSLSFDFIHFLVQIWFSFFWFPIYLDFLIFYSFFFQFHHSLFHFVLFFYFKLGSYSFQCYLFYFYHFSNSMLFSISSLNIRDCNLIRT